MTKKYTFNEIVEITKREIKEFDKIEQRPWGIEGVMIELMKQVGDLSKHVMMFEKYYLKKRENKPNYKTTTAEISDELADIFFCLVRIADYYDLDLEKAQLDARRFGLKYLGKKTDF